MRRILASLTVRMVLAFFVGLVLLQVFVVATIVWPDGRPTLFRLISPREAAAMALAIESVSGQQRDLFVNALNAGPLVVHLIPATSLADEPPESKPAPFLSELYARYASELGGRDFRVEGRSDLAMRARGRSQAASSPAIRLLVQLRTGDILIMERAPAILQRLIARFAIIGSATTIIVILMLLYCVHEAALPTKRLAEAARELATNIDMPDLPVRGTSEMSTLAVAFNEMKHTIRGLIS